MQKNKLINRINKQIKLNLDEVYNKNIKSLKEEFPNIKNDIKEINECFFIPAINFFNKIDKNIFVQRMEDKIFEELSNIHINDNGCLLFTEYFDNRSDLSNEFKLSEIKAFSNLDYLNDKIHNLLKIQQNIDNINKDYLNNYYNKLIQIKLVNKYIKSIIPNYISIDQDYEGKYINKYIIKINFLRFILKINVAINDNYINFNIFPKKSLLKEICQYLKNQGLYNLKITKDNRINISKYYL